MAKQTFTAGQVLTATQVNGLQTNDFNQTVSTKTAAYTFVVDDRGTRIVLNDTIARTFTIDNSIFSAGDTFWVHNINTGILTIAAGAGVTLNSASGLTLAQWEGGVIYFTSASSAIFFRTGSVNADFSNTATGTYSSGGVNYKYVSFTTTTGLTITRGGRANILMIAGGGGGGGSGGGNQGGGGGAGAMVEIADIFMASGSYTVTVGAAGAAGANPQGTGGTGGTTTLVIGGITYDLRGGGGGVVASATGVSGLNASLLNMFFSGSGGGGAVGGSGAQPSGSNGAGGAGGAGGGGGGAGGAGVASGGGGGGGAGRASSITGASVTYSAGGPANNLTAGATAGSGGGGGTNTTAGPGAAGASGLFVIAVRTN